MQPLTGFWLTANPLNSRRSLPRHNPSPPKGCAPVATPNADPRSLATCPLMDALSDWDANTPYQEEKPINIDFLKMKRANKAALDHLGQKSSPSHDRFAIRSLSNLE